MNNYQKEYYKKNKERIKETQRTYREKNKEKKKEYDKEYVEKNKEKMKKYYENYYQKNKEKKKIERNNPEKKERRKKWRKEYYQKNKEKSKQQYNNWCDRNQDKIKKYRRNYYKKNKKRINHIISWRSVLRNTLIRMDTDKEGHTIDMLGYSASELKEYMIKLFTVSMSWDNYGEWHIDHIKPVSSFNKNEKVSVVCALENLQPLWSTTRKIDDIVYEGNLNKYTN